MNLDPINKMGLAKWWMAGDAARNLAKIRGTGRVLRSISRTARP